MKKMMAVFALGLLAGVVISIVMGGFVARAEGESNLTQYERDHLYKLDQQIRAIKDLTYEVKRIADNTRN